MKPILYPKLAFHGVVKNRKLYLPYLISCIGTVMMFFIIISLSQSPQLMAAHATACYILSLGVWVIAVFAVIFLFYTNSLLSRRRYKEFAVYSVLGMDRKGISRIVLCENVGIALVSIVLGTLLGAAFSKLFELIFVRLLRGNVDFALSTEPAAVILTVFLFTGIFLLLTAKAVVPVLLSDPIRLMKKNETGEKALPKTNYALAVLGLLLLIGAYAIAILIKNPILAVALFFVAVLMVIAATYMLFISGSTALCGFLQSKKSYYYSANHFFSVAAMRFRMKRNGAGLASVCILSTMVLVMLTSTASLYVGLEDTFTRQNPTDFQLDISLNSPDDVISDELASELNKEYDENGILHENTVSFAYVTTHDLHSDIFYTILSAPEYEKLTGEALDLAENETSVFAENLRSTPSEITFSGDVRFTVTNTLPNTVNIARTAGITNPHIIMVIRDYECLRPLTEASQDGFFTDDTSQGFIYYNRFYGWDGSEADTETACRITHTFPCLSQAVSYSTFNSYSEWQDFIGVYGGMFFLGILLSLLFLSATIIIIYYKQISEGYEDCDRYAIMRKIGLTSKNIKRNINSQMLTVFVSPLLTAGLHLTFAFPIVWQMLKMFGLTNMGLSILINILVFLCFCLFYGIVYRITSREYFKIVTEAE